MIPLGKVPRVLLYCHNAMGIGHLMRTGKIAGMLRSRAPDIDVMIVTGSRNVGPEVFPAHVAVAKLPSAQLRSVDGQLEASAVDLSLSIDELISLRSEIIRTIVANYRPDVLLVDHNPSGFFHELDLTLAGMKSLCPTSKLILGMRGVAFGDRDGNDYFERYRHYLEEVYDHILVYVDRSILDLQDQYELSPTIANKMHYTGYISRTDPSIANRQSGKAGDEKIRIAVATGSGAVGYPILKAVVDMLDTFGTPNWHVTLVAGPYMTSSDAQDIEHRVAKLANPDVEFWRFITDFPNFLASADLFIGRGGYNTLVDVISSGCYAIIVPFEVSHGEQLAHASLLAKRGYLTILPEQELDPRRLHKVVSECLERDRKPNHTTMNLKGADNTTSLLLSLVGRK